MSTIRNTGTLLDENALERSHLIEVEDDSPAASNHTTVDAILKQAVKSDVGLGNVQNIKTNLVATVNPTGNDDSGDGYSVYSPWFNTTTQELFICKDPSAGSAVWSKVTSELSQVKHTLDATTDPTVDDDYLDGHGYLSFWCNIALGKAFVCVDPSGGAAVWIEIGSGGGSGNVSVDPLEVEFDSGYGSGRIDISGVDPTIALYSGSGGWGNMRTNVGRMSGKYYLEFHIGSRLGDMAVGMAELDFNSIASLGSTNDSWAHHHDGNAHHDGGSAAVGSTWGTGSVMMIAMDLAAGKLWFGKDGTWFDSGDPASGVSPVFSNLTGTLYPFVGIDGTGDIQVVADESNFTHTPPAGFAAYNHQEAMMLKVQYDDALPAFLEDKIKGDADISVAVVTNPDTGEKYLQLSYIGTPSVGGASHISFNDNYGIVDVNGEKVAIVRQASGTPVSYMVLTNGTDNAENGPVITTEGTGSVQLNLRGRGTSGVGLGNVVQASGYSSVAAGYYSVAAGNFSFSSGRQTQAYEDYTFAAGFYAQAMGKASQAFGQGSEALAPYSSAFGYYTAGYNFSQIAFGMSPYGLQGFAGGFQGTMATLLAVTVDATPTVLTIGGYENFVIGAYQTLSCEINVVAREISALLADVHASFLRRVLVKNVNGSAGIVGSVETIGTDVNPGGWGGVTIVVNDTNDTLEVTVTGAAATPIAWHATIRTSEISGQALTAP